MGRKHKLRPLKSVDESQREMKVEVLNRVFENDSMIVLIVRDNSRTIFKVVHWGYDKPEIEISNHYLITGRWIKADNFGWQFESEVFTQDVA